MVLEVKIHRKVTLACVNLHNIFSATAVQYATYVKLDIQHGLAQLAQPRWNGGKGARPSPSHNNPPFPTSLEYFRRHWAPLGHLELQF